MDRRAPIAAQGELEGKKVQVMVGGRPGSHGLGIHPANAFDLRLLNISLESRYGGHVSGGGVPLGFWLFSPPTTEAAGLQQLFAFANIWKRLGAEMLLK